MSNEVKSLKNNDIPEECTRPRGTLFNDLIGTLLLKYSPKLTVLRLPSGAILKVEEQSDNLMSKILLETELENESQKSRQRVQFIIWDTVGEINISVNRNGNKVLALRDILDMNDALNRYKATKDPLHLMKAADRILFPAVEPKTEATKP